MVDLKTFLGLAAVQLSSSTAQLQGNIRARLKRVQDVSGTHAKRIHASEKPRDKAATRCT